MNQPTLRGKTLEKSDSLAELRVSNGKARYCQNKEGKLIGLHLADTNLTDTELVQLLIDVSALEVLHIARNDLTELSSKLPNLKFLDARENEKLTKVDLSECPNLEKVVLNRCAISSLILPTSVPQLTQLEVANNQLTDLPLKGDISKLRFLDVSENQLTQLPTVLADCKKDFYLLAVGNEFDEITSGILRDPVFSDEDRRERLKDYLGQFKAKVETVDTLKLIFLGNTQTGKTTLADLLTGHNHAEKGSTHGVNLFEQKIKDTQIIGIDFGGQDYYHSIHFPLFNEQALYVLLWGNGQEDGYGVVKNKKTGEPEDIYPLHYWLGEVEYYIRETRKIPKGTTVWKDKDLNLYLIHNQRLTNNLLEKPADLNNRDLKQNKGVDELYSYCLSPKVPQQAEAAKEAILKLVEDKKIRRELPEFYIKLREAINKARESGQVILGLADFQKTFPDKTPEEITLAVTNLSYSVACHYLDESKLEEGVPFRSALTAHFITDLSQFTSWLYSILTIEELREKKEGYFKKADANRWLKAEEAKKYLDYMLGFMIHHKIIFEVKDKEGLYVVPQYLKPIKPGSVDALFLETFEEPLVKYEFTSYFHSNILAELIKRCYEYLLQEETGWKYIMWKNKVMLYEQAGKEKRFLYLDFQLPEAKSQENEDESEKEDKVQDKPTISLSRYSKKPVNDAFVQKIMQIIEKQIEYYAFEKWVKSPYGTYVPFELIKKKYQDTENKKESNLIFYHEYVYRRGDFKLFLPDEIIPMKKIFISYSHSDEGYKDELKRHFVSLVNDNLVSAFDDRELSMGGNWDLELKQKIDECDIMIALISVDFLNTSYIMKTEVPRAIEMGKTVVPIVVRPCDWTSTILGTYNGTMKGKVISLFEEQNQYYMPTFRSSSREERDMFWLDVVKEFRKKAFV